MAAQAPINQYSLALTPAQIASLPPDQQAKYLQGLSPQMQAIYQQELVNMANADFMRNSILREAYCPVTGGSGVTAQYTPGSTLSFDLPTTAGFAIALEIIYNLQVTPATGTGATYALTGSGKYGIFSRIELDYNGPQIVTHPIVLKYLSQLRGRTHGIQNAVLSGNNDATITNNIVGSAGLTVGSPNTWQGRFRLPLNPLGKESPYGLLPLSGVGNRPQLKLTCPANLYGADALLNAICSGGSGTGQAITVTGTVQVNCLFLDGTNMEGVNPKQLQNWQSMPTVQYYWEQSLSPFNANVQNRFTIATKLEHWYALAIVIDGQQSTAFISGWPNILSFGLSPDPTGQQYFENWNIANNVSIYDYFDTKIRDSLGQDLDEGVIPWVAAPIRGVVNASNQNGSQVLNMYPSGYPATTHIYTVAATGNVCTPRVELFLISKNQAGLKVS
jgi:hypothetical protein